MSVLFEFQASQLGRAGDDVAGTLAAVKMGLYRTPLTIDKNLLLATLDANKATYTGYAKQVVVWRAPSVADDNTVEVQSIPLLFVPTDAVTPNTIYGLWIEDTTAAFLYFAGQFDGAPLPMNSALDQITVVVRYRPATNTLIVVIS